MDPATALMIGSLATTAVGTGIGAAGAAQSAAAQGAAARYQQQVYQNSQVVAQQNAAYAQQAGRVQAQNIDIASRQNVGRAIAGASASGIDVTSGSPADVQSSIRQVGRFGALTALQDASLQSYGYRTQATGFGAQAGLSGMEAAQAGRAGGLGVSTSLIGGASQFSDKWLNYQLKTGSGSTVRDDFSGDL